MRIATWNVNSVRQRADHLVRWLGETKPDVVCLQELKCQDAEFPREAVEAAGYSALVHGQKGFNGVALLSRTPIEDPLIGLPGNEADEQSRYVEGTVTTEDGVRLRAASIYLPNGNPADTEKYPYKLGWMQRLHERAKVLLESEDPLVLAGDYNVIPEARDADDASAWEGDALFRSETRQAWRGLLNLGLYDAIRACSDASQLYTFWDYQGGAWEQDRGIRIDHLLLNAQAADRLSLSGVDRAPRDWPKPSDHTPAWAELTAPIR